MQPSQSTIALPLSFQLFLLPSPRAQGLNYMDGQEWGWLAASRQTRCSWHTCPVRARWSAGKEARWRADGRHCWQCLWVRRKWREGLWFQLCCLIKLNCYTLTKVLDSCLSEPVNVNQLSSSTSCVWAAENTLYVQNGQRRTVKKRSDPCRSLRIMENKQELFIVLLNLLICTVLVVSAEIGSVQNSIQRTSLTLSAGFSVSIKFSKEL